MEPVTLALRSKRQRRAAAVQKVQHLVPALILLGDGWSALARHVEGAGAAIALVEIVSGALFVLAAAPSIRGAVHDARPASAHHGVDWTDAFAAAVVFAETLERYHPHRAHRQAQRVDNRRPSGDGCVSRTHHGLCRAAARAARSAFVDARARLVSERRSQAI
jgi:hypothetical protein